MLITLQSNSDQDASDFVNFFKETVQIPEHAEIGLLGCSYKFSKTFTVTALNNTFQVRYADSGLLQATMTEGEYTADQFLDALNAALNDVLSGAIPYRIQLAFPDTAQAWSWTNANKDRLRLRFEYAPVDWDGALVTKDSVDTRKQVLLANSSQMTLNGNGIINKTTFSDSYDEGVNSAPDPAGYNIIWGTAEGNRTGETPHGVLRFQVPQLCQCMVCFRVGEKTTGFGTAGNWDAAIHFLKSGSFEIRERNAGLTVIKTDTYNVDDFFEIRIDRLDTNSDTETLRYFTTADPTAGFNEIDIDPAQPRLTIEGTTKLVAGAGVKTPKITGGIHAPAASIGANTGYKEDAILSNGLVIADGSSGYVDGELALAEGTTSSVTSTIKLQCDALGTVTGYSVESTQGGYQAGETIEITGSYSQESGATLTYSDPVTVANNSNFGAISGANTGYANGAADILIVSSATTISACVDLSTTGGAIDDFGFVSQAKVDEFGSSVAKTLADDARLEIVQGANNTAHFFVRNVRNVIPAIQGLGWSATVSTVDEPLVKHDDIEFACDEAFRSISGMPLSSSKSADGGVYVEGNRNIGTDRETQQMLINIEEFNVKSICKQGGVQKAIAMLPFGSVQPAIAGAGGAAQKIDGEFYYEPYNLVYHKFENPHLVNHNQLRVRFTDAVGFPLGQLQHPVTVTLDLRPRAN